ncbi:hypothetical protein AQ490_22155 [Wenjunlia vitaminophila]|uniref:Histidine kinase/HSP90-like ATPase domain-containing protein n=1 Tax=Wenjunlia vitaminophila TaxID=76728 RepID=A0A0T6LSF3_WENVI|nr:ATP-binding protein [Wenjunlia vitaminophila]KRV49018.1 hypothetical protein AQ490_22155 [Wenjunlia vitaminophila]
MNANFVAPASPAVSFSVPLSSTWRGARLARLLVVQQLESWGVPHTAGVSRGVAWITAELATNAVIHGGVPGRDFGLGLSLRSGTVRVEVSDSRPERPPQPSVDVPSPEAESGRGLLVVAELADRWGWDVRDGRVKVVWAERDLARRR